MSRRVAEQTYHTIMAWSASITVHLTLASVGALLAAASAQAPELGMMNREVRLEAPNEYFIEVPELPRGALAHWLAGGALTEPELARSGGERMPRPDSGRAGRGGDATSKSPAINLAARDDEAHMTPLLRSRIDRAQHARQAEGQDRVSPEDDTASDTPMMLEIFADGSGSRAEQRWASRYDPGSGGLYGGQQQRMGGPFAKPAPLGVGMRHRAIAMAEGNSSYDAMAGGVIDSWWNESQHGGAAVMWARPQSLLGRHASSANKRGDHADTVSAAQEDMSSEMDLFHASTAGGPNGDGKGGEAGPGATGSGGTHGPGSNSSVMGTGAGDGIVIDPADLRRRRYRRNVWMKIHNAWSASAFPKKAVLEGKQGYTIVSFTITKSGTVTGVSTTRPSGFPSFDAKMRAAVLRAAPFGPLPSDFGTSLRTSHEFVVSNSPVR